MKSIRSIQTYLLILGLLIPVMGLSQRETMTLFLALPKPVVLTGENFWYGVALDDFLNREGQFPVLHGYLSDRQGGIIDHWSIRPDSNYFIGYYQPLHTLSPGSYVLTMAIWDDSYRMVLEECDQVLQVLGSDQQTFMGFAGELAVPNPGGTNLAESGIRQAICLERTGAPALGWVGLQAWEAFSSWRSFRAPDLSTRFGYDLGIHLDSEESTGAATAYDLAGHLAYACNLGENEGSFVFADFSGHKDFQFVRLDDGKLLNISPVQLPKPLWKPEDLILLNLSSELSNGLLEQEEKRALIGNIFGYSQMEHEAGDSLSLEDLYDDEYDLSNYLPFESIELFIHEVVLPLKLIKKRNLRSIRVLNADVKNWFDEEPKLMINGVLQPSILPIYEIPYDQCTAIRLYRSLATTRQQFGPIARNGVIEIITKPSFVQTVPVIGLDGLSPGSSYRLMPPASSSDHTPFLVPMPMLRTVTSDPVCYNHQDETGIFRYQECRLENRHLVLAFKDYQVK